MKKPQPNWALVSEEGEIIDKFVLKSTALQMRPEYKLNQHDKLEVVSVGNLDEKIAQIKRERKLKGVKN
jgi:hypothetical protein